MVSEAWAGKCSNHPTAQPYFSLSPLRLQLLIKFLPIWICSCYRNMGFYLSFYICWWICCILPWPVSKKIQIKVRDQLNPLNTWSQTIESKQLTKPTSTEYSTVPTVRYPYFFPHSKLFNETDGYLHNDTIYIEIYIWPPNTTCSVFSHFSSSVETPISFNTLSVGWVVALEVTLNRP